jgi:hypothetical protein
MTYLDDDTWSAVTAHCDTKLDAPASAEAVVEFEGRHGVALPATHREFLMRGNGGVVGYVRLFGVGRPDALDLGQQVSEMRPELEGMADGPVLPFASDWGGSYFCYDLRRPTDAAEFPVLYWDHEYSEEPDDRPKLWSKFAPNFLAFVRKVIA